MKSNHPVTQREYQFPGNETLLSTTDTASHMSYANAAFIRTSGYSADELMGQPHNLVRHPDMPAEAFADMWKSLKGGESWTGLVKNRRQNGDHYWVRANATPIEHNGQVVGYMSVRTKPKAHEVQEAEALYQQMRSGNLKGRGLHKGLLVRTGWARCLSVMQLTSLRSRGLAACVAGAGLGILGAWAAGVTGGG